MAKRKNIKIGKLTICGEEYPACINVRVMMRLEDAGVEVGNILEDGPRRWTNLVKLISYALDEGAALTGAEEPPAEEELATMLDISDLADVSEQLAVLLGTKGRTIEAEPPKN